MASQPENTLWIFLIIRSAHWMLASVSLSVRGLPLWRPEQVVRCLHVQARKNCRQDSNHSLSAFVRSRSIAYSPSVRSIEWSLQF